MESVPTSYYTASSSQPASSSPKPEISSPDDNPARNIPPPARSYEGTTPLGSHKISHMVVGGTEGMSLARNGSDRKTVLKDDCKHLSDDTCREAERAGLTKASLKRKHSDTCAPPKRPRLDIKSLLVKLEKVAKSQNANVPEKINSNVVDLVAVDDAGNNETDTSISSSYSSGYTKSSGSVASDSEFQDSDAECSDFYDDFSIECVIQKLGRLDGWAFSAPPDFLQRRRTALAEYMGRAIDLNVIDIRDLKENVESLNKLYKSKHLFDRAGVSEPFVLVTAISETNSETYSQHELAVSKLFEFIQCSDIYDKLILHWRKLEFALPACNIPTRPKLILQNLEGRSRLLIGFSVHLDNDCQKVVVHIALDAEAAAWSNLKKKLHSELDACITIKCWQKHNPNYDIKMKIDIDYERFESSKLMFELSGENNSGEFQVFQTCLADQLFDITSGEVCYENFFKALDRLRSAYDAMCYSDNKKTASELKSIPWPQQTIFHLKLT